MSNKSGVANCLNCRKKYSYNKWNRKGKFCSWVCRNEFIRIKPKKCHICKKSYFPDRNRKNRQSKYCSIVCMGKSKMRGKIVLCKTCKKGVWRKNHYLNRYKNHYCSRKCYSIMKSVLSTGKNNSNWKDGISSKKYSTRGAGGSAYRKGKYYERKIRKELEKEGYYTIRSGASKGVWDIVGIRKDGFRLIQSKAGLSVLSPKERETIKSFQQPKNATKEVWHFYGFNKLRKEVFE